MPVVIAVAGNIGSGKTTLSKFIAASLGWVYIPRRRPELNYLEDLFKEPQRWSFEAQISFLASKVSDIQQAIAERLNIVIDRSVYEDIDIFARYFYKSGKLTERSYQTYLQVAGLLLETLPPPHILIYTRVSPAISKERIASRGYRKFERFYPPKYIEEIFELYEQWIKNYSKSPVAIFDTAQYDLRNREIGKAILEDIWILFQEYSQRSSTQLSLFDSFPKEKTSLKILKLQKKDTSVPHIDQQVIDNIKRGIQRSKRHSIRTWPSVYIAAPFTEFSNSRSVGNKIQEQLLDVTEPHGIIMPGKYRKILLLIARSFKKLGLNPILPHKDINRWGYKQLSAGQVAKACRQEVAAADLFFGIFSHSLGVHFEAGIAAGLNKPMIIVQVEELGYSFFAKGMSAYPKALALRVNTLKEVPIKLFSPEVLSFLERFHLLSVKGKEG